MNKHIIVKAFVMGLVIMIGAVCSAQTTTGFQWTADPNPDSMLNNEGDPTFATVLSFSTNDASADPAAIMDPSNWGSWADVAAALGSPLSVLSTPKPPSPLVGRFSTGTTSGADPSIVGDYAWAIVLDMDDSDFIDIASIPVTTWYTTVGLSSSTIANLFDAGTGSTAPAQVFTVDGPIQTTMMIPEPSVFALLGLGGLLILIRRRFVRR